VQAASTPMLDVAAGPFDNERFKEMLTRGVSLLMHGRWGSPHERFVSIVGWLDLSSARLSWVSGEYVYGVLLPAARAVCL
jgi:hypothetical protein